MLPQWIADIEDKNKIVYVAFKAMRRVQISSENMCFSAFAFLRKKGMHDKRFAELKKMKDKYKGERCFVIATGPSLTIEDLEKLKDEYTFGMNSVCLAYSSTEWRPSFFGIQDMKVFELLKDKIDESIITFLPWSIVKKYGKKKNVISFPCNSHYHDFELRYDSGLLARFSGDSYSVVYDGYSITGSLLQIAVYLGFNEIYLLGADCSYIEGEKQHFMEHGHVDPKYKSAGERNIVAYKAAKQYADEHGIKIFNSTRGGMLEVFERKRLEEVLNER